MLGKEQDSIRHTGEVRCPGTVVVEMLCMDPGLLRNDENQIEPP